jgi:hypothetical protein
MSIGLTINDAISIEQLNEKNRRRFELPRNTTPNRKFLEYNRENILKNFDFESEVNL